MHVSPRRHWRACTFAFLATAVLVAPATVSAKGKTRHTPTPTLSAPIAQGLAGPLQLAVDKRNVYVSQAFAGLLTKIGPGGRADIAANPGGEIAGVDVGRHHEVFYTSSSSDPATQTVTASALNRLKKDGSSVLVRDILTYESTTNNADGDAAYGFTQIDASCAAQWPVAEAGPPQYTGIVDSHPYAIAIDGRHNYVADAAANAIFDISKSGKIRVVAVLPPQPAVVTAEAATANGLPACTVGLTYNFEPVPTDVEVGRNGFLYVTTLPGGVEDASLGARGSVYRINPRSGKTRKIATGLLGATNLAIGSRGQIYVSELFANKVSRIVHGAPQALIDLPSPAGLEFANGKLYVGYDVFANGTLATINVGRGHSGHHSDRKSHFPRDRAAARRLSRILHL
ncbi:MAG: hypothetical protein QOH08_2006 [Chloroflexota bacterium]|nr:hypothetical protein [Chloroflexota bacterium]